VWKTVRRFDSGFPKDRSIFITVLISKKRVKNILFLQIKIQAQQYYAGKDNNRSVYFPFNEISVP
jgi:hypothetical protein